MNPIPLLMISGPVGVGKTSVAGEVSNILVDQSVPHTVLDLDCLAETYPRPKGDRFGSSLMLNNLRSIWGNCADAGSMNLVPARVIETQADKDQIADCVPNSAPVVCQLHAQFDTIVSRVRNREIGSGAEKHERRALELAIQLPRNAPADFVVDMENRSIVATADEIVRQVNWRVV